MEQEYKSVSGWATEQGVQTNDLLVAVRLEGIEPRAGTGSRRDPFVFALQDVAGCIDKVRTFRKADGLHRWTKAEVAELKQLALTGISAKQIADQISRKTTDKAIAAKIREIGLAGKWKSAKKNLANSRAAQKLMPSGKVPVVVGETTAYVTKDVARAVLELLVGV